MKRFAAALILAAVFASPAAAKQKLEHWAGVGSSQGRDVAAERLLVKFSTTTDTSQKSALLSMVSGSVAQELPAIGWTVVRLPPEASVASAVSALKNTPGIDQVDGDTAVHLHNYPSDPGVPSQYSLNNTDAFAGWDFTTGLQTSDGKPVTIAMIDAGVDFTVPDLAAKKLHNGAIESQFFDPDNSNAQSNDDPVTIACSHGTQTGSVAAASTNNGVGIAGVSWGAQLISLRVFNPADSSGDSCGSTFDSTIAAALNYVHTTLKGSAAAGHLVVNISIGGAQTCNSMSATKAALATVVGDGIPVTISAGNDGQAVNAPANCAGVAASAGIIPVGSSNSSNNISSYSSNGPELAAHGVAAPGENVSVDTVGGQTTTNSGTSFSAPFVAGLAALMIAQQPTLTPAQIEADIRGGANSIGNPANYQGAGQVNLFRSLKLVANGTLAGSAGETKAIAFPNPFRVSQTTVVSFSIPDAVQSSNPEVKIYTVNGQLVRDLKTMVWDGKNDSGQLVASGTYVFEVKTDAGHTMGRMAVIR